MPKPKDKPKAHKPDHYIGYKYPDNTYLGIWERKLPRLIGDHSFPPRLEEWLLAVGNCVRVFSSDGSSVWRPVR